jgi:hypothetical protein
MFSENIDIFRLNDCDLLRAILAVDPRPDVLCWHLPGFSRCDVVRRCALIDVALCTITCFRTLIPIHVISRPSTHYRSSYACIYISTFILVASRITLAASRSSPLVYPLPTTHVFDTLVLRTMRIPCGFDVCVSISAYDVRLHLSPTAQFGILQFRLYRQTIFGLSQSPTLRFPPAIAPSACDWHSWLTMSTRNFDVRFRLAKTGTDMRFRPAIAPAT